MLNANMADQGGGGREPPWPEPTVRPWWVAAASPKLARVAGAAVQLFIQAELLQRFDDLSLLAGARAGDRWPTGSPGLTKRVANPMRSAGPFFQRYRRSSRIQSKMRVCV